MGKTTLIRSIIGFTPPRQGQVRLKGQDITAWPSYRTVRLGMGLMPQGRRVFPSFTVLENLLVAAQGSTRPWTVERVLALFPRLQECIASRAGTLSGGEQQMLAIGRALMTNPDLLLMDESTEGLAPLLVREVQCAIAALKGQRLSMLLVEQHVSLALQAADYVHVLSRSRLVHSSAPEALWRNQEAKACYLGM
jgi:branched-chain amino acid transport system ATP-binding protein